MKILFNGNNVQMKLEQEPTTNLNAKQIKALKEYTKQYTKRYIKELINQNKIK